MAINILLSKKKVRKVFSKKSNFNRLTLSKTLLKRYIYIIYMLGIYELFKTRYYKLPFEFKKFAKVYNKNNFISRLILAFLILLLPYYSLN